MKDFNDIYNNRKLSKGYPNMGQLAHEYFFHNVASRPNDTSRIERLLTYLGGLIDLSIHKNIMILGCGPHPQEVKILATKGYKVVELSQYSHLSRQLRRSRRFCHGIEKGC